MITLVSAAGMLRDAAKAGAASQASRKEQAAERARERAKAAAEAAIAAAEEAAAGKLADRLDEAAEFISRFVWLTPAQADAMALLAALSNVTDTQVSLPRVLISSDEPESGKSVALRVGVSLSYAPVDTSGTWFDTKSAIFAAAMSGLPCPTLERDEISEIYGRSGTAGAGNPLGDILRRGYVNDATIGRSVNQSSDKASIFSIFWMTGLRVAIPNDIRTRSIVIRMTKRPHSAALEYFDLRDAAAEARGLNVALRHAVRGNVDAISAFRVRRDIEHRLLDDRNAEIFEGLFAVAAAAGQVWLNRCMAAFIELATDDANEQALSPREELIRDLFLIAAKRHEDGIVHGRHVLIRSAILRDELRSMSERYAPASDAELGRRITAALGRVAEVNIDGRTARGWYAETIETAWSKVRPAPRPDVKLLTEADPTSDNWDD